MVAGISCGHVVVVPYLEKATVVVGRELEAGAGSGEMGAVENDEREVKNEAVVHGELGVLVKNE
jgi:hypothetical protein